MPYDEVKSLIGLHETEAVLGADNSPPDESVLVVLSSLMVRDPSPEAHMF